MCFIDKGRDMLFFYFLLTILSAVHRASGKDQRSNNRSSALSLLGVKPAHRGDSMGLNAKPANSSNTQNLTGACEDSVTKERYINVNDDEGNTIDQAESCAEIMKKWPSLCEFDLIGGNGGRCCKSCGNPKCLDKVTPWFVLEVGNDKVKSCDKMVDKYPGLCETEGKNGGRCCRACKTLEDVKCQDKLKVWIVDGKRVPCSKYVKADPCRCSEKQVKSDCCASCKDAVLDNCKCRDSLSSSRVATISIIQHGVTISKDISDCKEIARYYAQFCQKIHLGGKKNACCKSCQGVDPECSDDLSWEITFGGCNDCSCHDLRKKSKRLMRQVCRKNLPGNDSRRRARRACCLQCSRLGFK